MVQVSHEVMSYHIMTGARSGLARVTGTRCGAPRCTSGRGSCTTSRITTRSPSWASGARSAATWRPGPGTRGSWCANPGEGRLEAGGCHNQRCRGRYDDYEEDGPNPWTYLDMEAAQQQGGLNM